MLERRPRLTLRNLILVICLSIVSIAGCMQSSPTTPTAPLLTATLTPSPTPAHTNTLTLTATLTPSPTQTPTLTVRPPTPSNTPLATLTQEERNALVVDLYLHNGGCQYPCYWGWTPGKTTWEEADRFISSLGYQPYVIEPGRRYEVELQNWQDEITVGAFVSVENNVIQSIRGYQNVLLISPRFTELSQKLSVHSIFEEYGPPDRIIVGLGIKSEEYPKETSYWLSLFYDKKGFMILIVPDDEAARVDKSYQICPNVNGIPDPLRIAINTHIGIQPFPGGKTLDEINFEFLSSMFPNFPEYPIEEISDLAAGEFYRMVMSQDKSACFLTPITKWR